MALLAKKLAFLPFMGMKAARPFMATYVSMSPAALRRQNSKQTVAVNGGDDTTTDEDEVMNQEAVIADDAGDDASDDLFQSVLCRVISPSARRPWATSQDETAVRFRMDMPGVAKENVKVYLDDDMKLVVRGRYVQLKEDEDHVLADNVGVYTAEILLPENVQRDKIKSEMKDGMLVVTAPKEVMHIPVD